MVFHLKFPISEFHYLPRVGPKQLCALSTPRIYPRSGYFLVTPDLKTLVGNRCFYVKDRGNRRPNFEKMSNNMEFRGWKCICLIALGAEFTILAFRITVIMAFRHHCRLISVWIFSHLARRRGRHSRRCSCIFWRSWFVHFFRVILVA